MSGCSFRGVRFRECSFRGCGSRGCANKAEPILDMLFFAKTQSSKVWFSLVSYLANCTAMFNLHSKKHVPT